MIEYYKGSTKECSNCVTQTNFITYMIDYTIYNKYQCLCEIKLNICSFILILIEYLFDITYHYRYMCNGTNKISLLIFTYHKCI